MLEGIGLTEPVLVLGLSVSLGVCVLIILAMAHTRYWRRRFHVEHQADEVHHVTCEDGARIALYRHRPAVNAQSGPAPALLVCHGLMTHAIFMDLGPRSLCRYLSRAGYDVWNLELRGTGRHSRVVSRRSWRIAFEDYVDQDAAVALRYVRERCGDVPVGWVGHSMGGLIGCGLGQERASRLSALVTIGSPGAPALPGVVRHGLSASLALVGWARRVPTRRLLTALSPFYVPLPLDPGPIRLSNMDSWSMRRLMAVGLEDVPITLARGLVGWTHVQRLVGARDFSAGMAQLSAPFLCVAGSHDYVSPPDSVRALYQDAGSDDKRFLLLGDDAAAGIPRYGHGDLVLGVRAEGDVFEPVLAFIKEHMPVSVGAASEREP